MHRNKVFSLELTEIKYFTIPFTLPASLTKCVLFMTKIHYKRGDAYDMIYVHRLLSSFTDSAQGGCGGRKQEARGSRCEAENQQAEWGRELREEGGQEKEEDRGGER